MKYYIGLDVGGTNIKASIIDSSGELLIDIKSFPSYSSESKNFILNNFKDIIKDLIQSCKEKNIQFSGIGMAFPGPFDYENGISLIKGLNKYESIYGVNVKEELIQLIKKDFELMKNFYNDFKIKFLNDGDLFSLGEYINGKAKYSNKTFCICIGTGVGSSFLEKGILIKGREDVPENGWIYHVPYKDSIIDDYISSRGVISISKKVESLKNINDVKSLSDLALNGNKDAKFVFDEFGVRLKETMTPFLDIFKPDTFIIGGQISKSFNLFGKDIKKVCEDRNIKIYTSFDTSKSALKGVAVMFREHLRDI